MALKENLLPYQPFVRVALNQSKLQDMELWKMGKESFQEMMPNA